MARSVFPWHVSYEREENRDHTHIQPLTTRYNRMAYRVACLHLALSSGRNIIMAEVTTLGASANGINEWKIISLPIVRSCQHNSNKEPLCAPHAKPNVYLVTLSKWFLLLWLGRSRINGAQEYESPHLGHNSRSTYYLLGEIENLHTLLLYGRAMATLSVYCGHVTLLKSRAVSTLPTIPYTTTSSYFCPL